MTVGAGKEREDNCCSLNLKYLPEVHISSLRGLIIKRFDHQPLVEGGRTFRKEAKWINQVDKGDQS